MGEGLQEALLVQFIKKPGDQVRRDDPLYVMETDKASTDIESPYDGTLLKWTVEEGTVLPVGTEVAIIELAMVHDEKVSHGDDVSPISATLQSHTESSVKDEHDSMASDRNGPFIPPRTKKYLKEKGILDQAGQIPCRGSKLMPEDVDRYLQNASSNSCTTNPTSINEAFMEQPVPKSQITLNYRLERSRERTIPATIMTEVNWTSIHDARIASKQAGGNQTGFAMLLWCLVQILKRHPKFRTALVNEGTHFRTYQNVSISVAVSVADDGLVMAVLKDVDALDRRDFFERLAERIQMARQGIDQADATTPFSVSNIGSAGIRFGIPTVVSPQVATLALGEVFEAPVPSNSGFSFQKRAQLTLSFDHRIVNGVGAANFLVDLKRELEEFTW